VVHDITTSAHFRPAANRCSALFGQTLAADSAHFVILYTALRIRKQMTDVPRSMTNKDHAATIDFHDVNRLIALLRELSRNTQYQQGPAM
jgi:hypothetical protein